MWDWEEGLGEAISTFYQAEQFLREYDYIFNHNEALLYASKAKMTQSGISRRRKKTLSKLKKLLNIMGSIG